jgi:septal ring factor EnvC (AmiA/AmiB activator)
MKANIRLKIIETYPDQSPSYWEEIYLWIMKPDMEEAEQLKKQQQEEENQSDESYRIKSQQDKIEEYQKRKQSKFQQRLEEAKKLQQENERDS